MADMTPALIHGIRQRAHPLSGAAAYERFKELVDTALEQAQSAQRTN